MSRRELPKLSPPPPPPAPFRQSRAALPLTCFAIVAFFVIFYAGAGWPAAVERLPTDGPLLLLWLASAAGLGCWLLPVFAARGRPGAFVTAAALGIGLLSLLILALGLAGALN